MKVEKIKVLLYLKRSGLDKSGKAPIMGRITVNRTMAQFSSKLSCTPELWNPRESRLNTTDDSKPNFPLPCWDMIWFEIHELGFAHQFKHNLSYHQSRHTFGTLLVSAGVPMESIAKMMGHTNIRTTQGYAKVTDDKISEDMDRLMEKRKQQIFT